MFVRHAQCLGNAQDRIVGQRDYPLTSLGYAQARQAAELIKRRERVSAVYSSDLLAARETARIIAGPLGVGVIPDAALREQSFGRLEGLRRADMDFSTAERRPLTEVHWGGGESVAEVYARVERFLATLPEGATWSSCRICTRSRSRCPCCAAATTAASTGWNCRAAASPWCPPCPPPRCRRLRERRARTLPGMRTDLPLAT